MALRKKAPEGIAVRNEDEAIEVARKRAHWHRVPAPYRPQQGDEDPHELQNMLSEDEKYDAVRFHQGDMQKCYVGKAIDDKNKEEERMRLGTDDEDFGDSA